MPPAPVPDNEAKRLASLINLDILDTGAEAGFDALVSAAALTCGVRTALIGLIDAERQWFKATLGMAGASETPREATLCAYTILSDDLLEVSDATIDDRFADNPSVTGEMGLRFYAGAPLCLDDGSRVGVLCVIDQQPRGLDGRQRVILKQLAQAAVALLQERRTRQLLRQATGELQTSEERLRRLYEATPAMLQSLDADGRLCTVSDLWLERLGYTRDEVVGRPIGDFLTPEFRGLASALERPIPFIAGRCDDIAMQFVAKSGEVVDVLWSEIPDGEPDGRPRGRLASVQDVTLRRRAEEALAVERQRLENVIEGAELGTFEWNLKTNEVRLNERWANILGHTLGELQPVSFATRQDRVHPGDVAVYQAALERHRTGAAAMYECECRMRHRDGHWVWMLSRGKIMSWSPEGQPLSIFGIVKDITDRKRQAEALLAATQALEGARERVTVATESAGIGVWEWVIDSNELVWDRSMHRLYGRAPERGPPAYDEWWRCMHPDDVADVAAALADALTGLKQFNTEFRTILDDGSTHHIRAASHVIRDQLQRPVRMVGINWEVTEARQLEAERETRMQQLDAANLELERLARHLGKARTIAEQANTAKSRFLAGMSHELRTPLNGILGYAQLLRLDGELSCKQSERVGAMMTAGTHLLEMIGQVLDLSAIEAGSEQAQLDDVDLQQLCDAMLNTIRPQAVAKSLKLELRIAADLPRRVQADVTRLQQTVLNLLGNAVKFSPTGQITLHLSRAAAAERLRIEVADAGPGIPADKRDRLFREFDRLDDAAVRGIVGSGLGLSLAASLARLMGGTLGYDDNPGGGSLFWLELPLIEADPAGSDLRPDMAPNKASEAALARDLVAAAGSNLPILIVDDNPVNCDIAAAFLQSVGYDTVCLEDGEAGVGAAADTEFLAVLMDVRMPGIDGLEATRRIRALPGLRSAVPVVALTAQAFADEIEACLAIGMDTHVLKPFSLESLLTGIQRAVAAGRARTHAQLPPAVALGSDLPVLDSAIFDRTVALLQPEIVTNSMCRLVARAEALQRDLLVHHPISTNAEALAEAAHALAGGAGMFGFERLVVVARHFERGARHDLPEAAALVEALSSAVTLSLHSMRSIIDRIAHRGQLMAAAR